MQYAISKSILTTIVRFMDCKPPLKLLDPFFFISARKNCIENLLRRLQHSWQVIVKIIDPYGLMWYSWRHIDKDRWTATRIFSASTICIKYSETLGSIVLYGDGPLDCPHLPATYPDSIVSLLTLAWSASAIVQLPCALPCNSAWFVSRRRACRPRELHSYVQDTILSTVEYW